MAKTLDELIDRHDAEEEALDLLIDWKCFATLHEEFNSEILKIKEKYELPEGALGALCGIEDDQLEIYREAWLKLHSDVPTDNLSTDVWEVFNRQWSLVRFNKTE